MGKQEQSDSGWQPIETAPKDREIDLWVQFPDTGHRWANAQWREAGQHNCRGPANWCTRDGWPLHGLIEKPIATHWMPLPSPPHRETPQ